MDKIKQYLFIAYEMYVCGQDRTFVDYEARNGSQGLYEREAFEKWLDLENLRQYLIDER